MMQQPLRHQPADRRQVGHMAHRVASLRQDIRRLEAELARLEARLSGPQPHVSHELPRRFEILGNDLRYLADSLRAAPGPRPQPRPCRRPASRHRRALAPVSTRPVRTTPSSAQNKGPGYGGSPGRV